MTGDPRGYSRMQPGNCLTEPSGATLILGPRSTAFTST
jgi:hypothetical protein